MEILFKQLNEALARGESAALITVIESDAPDVIAVGNKRLLLDSGGNFGTLGDDEFDKAADIEARHQVERPANETAAIWSDQFQAAQNIEQRRPLPRVRLLIERLQPQPSLLICGAGHIARALAQLGLTLGFRAVVIDDRPEFASREFFPDPRVELTAMAFEEAIAQTGVKSNTSVVIVTRGHKHDEDCLRLLLDSPAQYIGMIGSRRRVAVVFEKLESEGFSRDRISRIYAPIGLDIGARTPEEIALAILAEIILVRNRPNRQDECAPLSLKPGKTKKR